MLKNYKEFLEYLNKLNTKPSLLLQVCCGPCSTVVLSMLNKYFNVTVYYVNDNTYPEAEYDKRYLEVLKVINIVNKEIKCIKAKYNEALYLERIKGLENLGEKSERCYECYKLRLERTAIYAKENNFDYFTTTLSISPYKNANWLNEIGYSLEEKYNVKYLFSDFKKDEGYKKSILLSKEYGLYRQHYCGCRFSYALYMNSIKEED